MRYPFSTKIALLQQCVTLLVLKLDIGTILILVWKKFSLNNNVNAVVLHSPLVLFFGPIREFLITP